MAEPGSRVGQVLGGRYRLEAPIGRGGFGAVYRATNLATNQRVALKLLHDTRAMDERATARFEREAQLSSRLGHPNVVRVFDFGRTEHGELYLVMELLHGETLREVLGAERTVAPQRVVRIGAQICAALAEAHSLGLVHRDLKPANVLLCDVPGHVDFVKVVDFGIARARDSETLTAAGAVLGTPAYMAPEQADPAAPLVDGRSDLYSLGVILYELLSGAPPFQGEPMRVMLAHLDTPAPALRPTPERPIPAPLAATVMRLLSKAREDRFPSALAVADALRRSVRAAPTAPETAPRAHPPPIGPPPQTREPLARATQPPPRAHRSLPWLAGGPAVGLVIAALIGLAVWIWREAPAATDAPDSPPRTETRPVAGPDVPPPVEPEPPPPVADLQRPERCKQVLDHVSEMVARSRRVSLAMAREVLDPEHVTVARCEEKLRRWPERMGRSLDCFLEAADEPGLAECERRFPMPELNP